MIPADTHPADLVMPILTHPDARLNEIARDAEPGEEMADLLTRMVITLGPGPDTNGHWRGVGLAAPQVGRLVRAIVVHEPHTGKLWCMLNPRIVERSGVTISDDEGCLSVPGLTVRVRRPASVRVEGITAHGEPLKTGLVTGLTARTFVHEIEHLNGMTLARFSAPRTKRRLQAYP